MVNRSRKRRSGGGRSRGSRSSRGSRGSRGSRSRQSGGSGFGAILKEAIVPILFLGANVKLKKKTFGNKTFMIPIFKNMNNAKLERDRSTGAKRRKGRRKGTKRRKGRRKGTKRRKRR